MMKISFIVPVYNCKVYLPACVDSIRTIGIENYEILLVDDGSTDGSGKVCDGLADRFPEVRVIHQKNGGASAARNRGLEIAAGERIVFVDSDDTIESDAMRTVIQDQRFSNSDLILYHISFDYYKNHACYRSTQAGYPYDGVMDQVIWAGVLGDLFRCDSLTSACTKVFRRALLEKHGIRFRSGMIMYEDFEFVLRYMRHCDRIWNVPQAVYHYRQSEDEGNAGRRLKRIACIPEFLKPIEAALHALPETVSETDRAMVLQQLHLVLAREKIAVSDIDTIRSVCRDYQNWTQNRLLPMEQDQFQTHLLEGNALLLYLRNKKSQLRHWVAVRVKAFLKRG